ncbi:MAG TPA: nucleotide exchange factor GrpE [Thermoanaerobaculia bacterium]|jgi:molecular chaperone GrpE
MADKTSDREATELDLDDSRQDLESAMRAAVAAVEDVEAGAGGTGNEGNDDDPAGATSEVARLRQEVADLRDRSMRTLADFDNFRKRSERERQEARRYALLEPMRDMLTVVDNLERALSAEGSADDLKRGVEMTLKGLRDLLRRHGVQELAAAGAAFDPAVHEAVMRQEDPAVQVPTVLEELQRGYFLNDRLLRPAMVKVGVPVERKPGPAGSGEPSGEPSAGPAGGSTGGNGSATAH